MTLADILDGAFKLIKANARTVFTVVAAFVIPVQLIASISSWRDFQGPGFFEAFNNPIVFEEANGSQTFDGWDVFELAGTGLSLLLLSIGVALAGAAMALVVLASYEGEEIGPGEVLRAVSKRLPTLIGAWVLVHLIELSTVVLCFVPLLVVMPLLVMVSPIVMVEDAGARAAVKRSWYLGRRQFWRTVGIVLLAGLIGGVVGQVLGTLPALVGLLIGSWAGWLAATVGGIIASLLVDSLLAMVAVLLYIDVRIRHEGLDLQIMARTQDSSGRASF